MVISQVIQRLQELQTVLSDVHVVLQDDHGELIHEYFIDIYVGDNGVRSVMIYREVIKEQVHRSRSRR